MTKMLLIGFSLFASFAYTAPNPPRNQNRSDSRGAVEEVGSEKAPELKPSAKTGSTLELRPTFHPRTGGFRTENLLELGYYPHPNLKLAYVQAFDTNIYEARHERTVFKKLGFILKDAYIRAKLGKIWEGAGGQTSFTMQQRLYLPTGMRSNRYPSRLNQGLITYSRTYFTLHHIVFPFMEIDFAYAPVFFIYRKSGFTAARKDIANPFFEHLVNPSFDFKVSQSVLFTIPVVFRMTRYRNYTDSAVLNNRWGYNLNVIPELDWELNSQHTLGAAFVTENLLKSDGSGTDWKNAFKLGVVQAVWYFNF